MIIDKVLEKIGVKYEDLSKDERDTFDEWSKALNKNVINVGSIKAYIASMRESVEQELTKTDHNTKQDLFLKARLRNYMLLEAYLSTPEKAKQALERTIASMVSKREGT